MKKNAQGLRTCRLCWYTIHVETMFENIKGRGYCRQVFLVNHYDFVALHSMWIVLISSKMVICHMRSYVVHSGDTVVSMVVLWFYHRTNNRT